MDSDETTLIYIPPGNTTITLPPTVTAIGDTVLQYSPNLKELILQDTSKWISDKGILYSSNMETLVAVCGGVTSVEVPSSV